MSTAYYFTCSCCGITTEIAESAGGGFRFAPFTGDANPTIDGEEVRALRNRLPDQCPIHNEYGAWTTMGELRKRSQESASGLPMREE